MEISTNLNDRRRFLRAQTYGEPGWRQGGDGLFYGDALLPLQGLDFNQLAFADYYNAIVLAGLDKRVSQRGQAVSRRATISVMIICGPTCKLSIA